MARTTPAIEQVRYTVRGMIAEGALAPGDPAPTVPELQEATGVCRAYCHRALRLLTDDGTLVTETPRGRRRVAGPVTPGRKT